MPSKKFKHKRVTIDDVAKAAGVSKTTISRYINGKYDSMSVETRHRIKDIIDELNYRPNKTAQSLKSDKTKIIGCVIADITNSFSTNLVKGINDVCTKKGYQVFFVNTDNNPKYERNNILSLLDNKLDGLIVNSTGGNDDYLIEIHEQGIPVVMADRYLENNQVLDLVTSTNYQSAYQCVKFLNQQNYDEVYFISQEIGNNKNREIRHDAFQKACVDFYGEYDDDFSYFVPADDARTSLIKLENFIRRVVSQKGNNQICFFAVNGTVLLDIIKASQNLKYTIGKDFGVCGFDDWEWASLIQPGITAIRQDTYNTGKQAAKLLIDRIEKSSIQAYNPKLIELPTELVIRGSTTIKCDTKENL